MAIQARGLVMFLLVAAALISYGIGSMSGLVFFIAIGAVFEMLFWFKLFGKKRKS